MCLHLDETKERFIFLPVINGSAKCGGGPIIIESFCRIGKYCERFLGDRKSRNFLSVFREIYFNGDSHQRLCDIKRGNPIVLITFAHQVFTVTDK